MLSSRGAMDIRQILKGVVESKPIIKSKTVLLFDDAMKVWTAMCGVLRLQLIHHSNVLIFPKACGVYLKRKHIVTDGDSKYHVYLPVFGFHPNFCTTYSLDSSVERVDDSHGPLRRLPLDHIAQEARLPADFCNDVLHEAFLFIGERLFSGALLQIDFEGVGSLLVKREKSVMSFSQKLCDDIFAIDSRKWPIAIRGMAEASRKPAVTPRPTSMNSARPRSGSAQPNRSSPQQQAAAASSPDDQKPLTPRPAFTAASYQGRLFSDLAEPKQPKQPKQAPAKRPFSSKSKQNDAKKQPQFAPPPYTTNESIYTMLTPNAEAKRSAECHDENDADQLYHDEGANDLLMQQQQMVGEELGDDVAVPRPNVLAEVGNVPLQGMMKKTPRPTTPLEFIEYAKPASAIQRPQTSEHETLRQDDLFFFGGSSSVDNQRGSGRRRVMGSAYQDSVRNLLMPTHM